MERVLVSLMCHPDREPKIDVPSGDGFESFVNRTPNYADAYRYAIGRALDAGADLVTADTDGYHPPAEIVKLASGGFGEGPALVLPYRENIGLQSKSYSLLFSLVAWRRIRDSTGGLCRLSLDLMKSLPPLKAADMTVHIEILKHALKSRARIVQYGYTSSANDETESRRTSNYQWKLLGAMFR
ncbi:MAG: hypothetical protein JRM73_04410 [Nitrososphaerota archaeon]|nr:hypothetical protein [Nitrososphaerota archaeon]